ncbi:hypothetical protein Tco_1164653 [Tanacetum coccineum]
MSSNRVYDMDGCGQVPSWVHLRLVDIIAKLNSSSEAYVSCVATDFRKRNNRSLLLTQGNSNSSDAEGDEDMNDANETLKSAAGGKKDLALRRRELLVDSGLAEVSKPEPVVGTKKSLPIQYQFPYRLPEVGFPVADSALCPDVLAMIPFRIRFSNETAFASNSPKEEKEKGRNPYSIAAHLAVVRLVEVEDLNCSGIHYTWVQSRQDPSSGILKKIDRVLASFILHSESGLGHDASADLTAEADHRISAPKDSISLTTGNGLKTANTTSGANKESGADDISQKVKLEDFSDILKDTRSAFFTPDSPTYEPIIVLDESKEEEDAKKDKDTEDTSVPPPLSLKSAQIQELMA